jgi:hypothetical protein
LLRATIAAAAIGGSLAVVEGLLLIALGSLGGLAENPEGETAMTDGYVVAALGVIVLAAVFLARRSPLVLSVATAATAAFGFLVDNALWIFAAVFLFAAAALGLVSNRELRSTNRNDNRWTR